MSGLQNDLRVAFDALVKLVVGHRSVIEWYCMRNDETRLRPASNNQISQIAIVPLDIALARPEAQPLFKELPKGDEQLPLPGVWIDSTGVRRYIQTGDTEHTRRVHNHHECIKDDRGGLAVLAGLNGLVAHGIDALIHTISMPHLADLLDRISFAEVNGNGSNILRLLEALRHAVNHVDFGSATNKTTIGGHQANRSRAEDRHRFARRDLRQFRAVVPCGEDIGQQGKILFVLGPLWQLEGIKVCIRHAQVLGLTTGVRPHRYIPIGPASETGIDSEAEAGKAAFTILTKAASNVEWHYHTISLAQGGNAGANFLDDPHVFVSKDDSRLRGGSAFIHMQIRTTDAGGGNTNNHIVGMLNLRVGYLFDSYLKRFLVHNSSHGILLRGLTFTSMLNGNHLTKTFYVKHSTPEKFFCGIYVSRDFFITQAYFFHKYKILFTTFRPSSQRADMPFYQNSCNA